MQTGLYISAVTGRIGCGRHMPRVGTDTWVHEEWAPLSERDAVTLGMVATAEGWDGPECETCQAKAQVRT